MQTLWQYLRYAERMLAKKSCFTLIAVIMLALGVCANSSVFSSVNALLAKQTPAAVTASQPRKSRGVRMSPEAWPPGELEKYWRLQRDLGRPHPSVESAKGMVAVTHDAFSARIGLEALRQGGSAADAALATSLAQIVLDAGAVTSYAGIMTMVYYDAASKKVYSLNAGYNTVLEEKDPLTIPGGGKPSGRTALVPGFFAGVQAAHDRFGKLPFASLFDPAIYLAEKGFVVDPVLGWINIRKDVLSRLPETKRVFTKQDGEFYKAGDLFKQPQLAETLRKIAAQGTDYIYQGEWANKFVAAVQSEGGKMALADLKAYRPTWSEPLQTNYHGYQVYSLGLPSLGGVNTIEAFNLLEAADLKQYGHYTVSPDALYEFIRICRAGYFLSFLPTDFIKTYLPDLDIAPESRVKKESAKLLWRKMHEPAWEKMLSVFAPKGKAGSHSAGVVVVDGQGNMAAVNHTINAVLWGSTGIFVDGVSIPDSAASEQSKMARIKPGDRLPETTNPVIVLKNDKPYLASSSVGYALLQTTMSNLVNVLDFGMDLKKSIDTPNFLGFYLGNFIGGGPVPQIYMEVLAEGEFDESLVKAVIAKGQAIKLLPKPQTGGFGYWVAIQIDPKTGKRIGVSPPLLNGEVAGY
ncbi:MAG TPA: gamma-glutamyltransferase [Blastocatellia bacterium]|nr:gamma-glutamyltransferase [Blastocatellia bacterium]